MTERETEALMDSRRLRAQERDRDMARAAWEQMDRADLLAELERTEQERQAWESHGQEETFQRERTERDWQIIVKNRDHILYALTQRLAAKETALLHVMEAASLAEANVGPIPDLAAILRSRADELVALPEGWDSYGGKPIDPRAATKAVEVALALAPLFPDYPPQLVPGSDGSVTVEFHSGGFDVEAWVATAR